MEIKELAKLQRDQQSGMKINATDASQQHPMGGVPRSSGKDRFRSSIQQENARHAGAGSTDIEGAKKPQQQDRQCSAELPIASVAVIEGRELLAVNAQGGDSDPICICRMNPYERDCT